VIKRHHTARRASPPSHAGPPLSRLIDRIWDEHGVKAWPELRRNRCTSGASHASPGRVDVTVDSCTPPVPTDLAQHGELLLVQEGPISLRGVALARSRRSLWCPAVPIPIASRR
jgi:hypothetical protein